MTNHLGVRTFIAIGCASQKLCRLMHKCQNYGYKSRSKRDVHSPTIRPVLVHLHSNTCYNTSKDCQTIIPTYRRHTVSSSSVRLGCRSKHNRAPGSATRLNAAKPQTRAIQPKQTALALRSSRHSSGRRRVYHCHHRQHCSLSKRCDHSAAQACR